MAESSAIEWTDATFNPWIGCDKVSPGCAHCYAETLVTGRMGREGTWGPDGVRQVTSPSNWKKPLRWAALAREGRLPDGSENSGGHRPRVFCASLADAFEERPELEEPRLRLFDLIAETPELDWLILTKRPDFARDWLRAYYEKPISRDLFRREGDENWNWRDGIGWGVLPNVWVGTSIENARYTYRADVLREIPAAVRFLSCEPLLGSLYRPGDSPAIPTSAPGYHPRASLDLTGIDWVIVGGESGGRASRPMHPEWAREIRNAVLAEEQRRYDRAAGSSVGVECVHGYDVCPTCDGRPAFFFKQWGSWAPAGFVSGLDSGKPGTDALVGTDGRDVTWKTFYRGSTAKSGGRLLDGREWNEMPRPERRY